MKTHVAEKPNLFPYIREEEEKSVTLKFRATPSQAKYWEESLRGLGVKDFSSFARGAIQAAIEMGQKANDPKWQEFLEAIQPIAKKKLGYGIFHGGAAVTEGYGKERKGISAEDFKRQVEKGKK